MLHFADALKQIGALYYAAQDDRAALSQLEGFNRALQKARSSRVDLEIAKYWLDDAEAFAPELETLARYAEILVKEIADLQSGDLQSGRLKSGGL
jgi:uncharacterized protein YPO0396